MTLAALLSAAVILAENPDPGPPLKDCGRFLEHYRELMQDQAVHDSAAKRPLHDPPPSSPEVARARLEGAQAAKYVQDEVARACREANGMQYACVVSAGGYLDLASCELPALPVLDTGQRKVAANLEATPRPSPEERAREAAQVLRAYVRSGTIDVEAMGTGSVLPELQTEEPPAAASAGQ